MARRASGDAAAPSGKAADAFRGVDRLRSGQSDQSFSALDAVENPKATKASPADAPHSPYGELTIETFPKH